MSSWTIPSILVPSPEPFFLLSESAVSEDAALNQRQFVFRMMDESLWVSIADGCHIIGVKTFFSTYYHLVFSALHDRPYVASLIGSTLETIRTTMLALRTMQSMIDVASGSDWYRTGVGLAARVARNFLHDGSTPLSREAEVCSLLFRYAVPLFCASRAAWHAGRRIRCLSQFRDGVLMRFVERMTIHSSSEFSAKIDYALMFIQHISSIFTAERYLSGYEEGPKSVMMIMVIAAKGLSALGHVCALTRTSVNHSREIRRIRANTQRQNLTNEMHRRIAGNGAVRVGPPVQEDPFSFDRPGSLLVNGEVLREDPAFYLEKLYQLLFVSRTPTFRVSYVDADGVLSPATDAGGPARQFLMELFQAALEKGLFVKRMGAWVPHKGEPDHFIAVGGVLVYCLQNERMFLPSDFSPNFFTALASVPEDAIENNRLSEEESRALCEVLDPNGEVAERIAGLLAEGEWDEEQIQLAAILTSLPADSNTEQLRAELLSVQDEYFEEMGVGPILSIARGMRLLFGPEWQRECGRVSSWPRRIQGFVASELDELPLGRQRWGAPTPEWQQKCDWLQRWWGGADEESRKGFLVTAIGTENLGRVQELQLDVQGDVDGSPFFHTCAGQMDIPNYPTYEIFAAQLAMCVASTRLERELGTGAFHAI